jgi:hypothetical protein
MVEPELTSASVASDYPYDATRRSTNVYPSTVLKFYSCQTRNVSGWHGPQDELPGLQAVFQNRAIYACALQRDRFSDSDAHRPGKDPRWQRDGVAVVRLVIVDRLDTRCRPVGGVNRSVAARARKAAQNKDRDKNSQRLHNRGLSVLAIHKRR